MDSANHEHGASAARPPPLPEATASANPATVSPSDAVVPCSREVSAPEVVAAPQATKKRPLGAPGNSLEIQKETPVPAPKKNSHTEKKPIKAKKTLKKKKKKFSSILSGMMQPKKKPKEGIEAEREALRKHLGGGNFVKVDKI
jgi:hypothetical protein